MSVLEWCNFHLVYQAILLGSYGYAILIFCAYAIKWKQPDQIRLFSSFRIFRLVALLFGAVKDDKFRWQPVPRVIALVPLFCFILAFMAYIYNLNRQFRYVDITIITIEFVYYQITLINAYKHANVNI